LSSLAIIGIAVSLAMDAFSVSIASGVKIKEINFGHYFRLAFHFGLFQFLMPLLGFYGGAALESAIKRYDHWVAFLLLAFIGGKMIWESFCQGDSEEGSCDPSRGKTLIMLSVATSIDAAAVGFSFAALGIPIVGPALIIGAICLIFSALGVFLGDRVGAFIGPWAERIGGVMLILIGLKIVLDHLYF
jgi:putative Mn2+ efflux pump MntP